MNKVNLVLHCGASACERGNLTNVPTPQPTDTWHPIPHVSLLNQVEQGLENVGLTIREQAHSLTRDGARYFGLLQVARKGDSAEIQDKADYGYVLGLRNSHDKSFPAGLVVGSQVFVCDNLAFNGEIKIARKHTRYILNDLPALVSKSIGLLGQRWNRLNERIERYKKTQLNNEQAHDLVVRALDAGACLTTQIPGILKEWRAPSHPEFTVDGNSAWRLFNAFTEVQKGAGLAALPVRTTRLHGLLDAQCGLGFDSFDTSDVVDTEVAIAE